jgi:hypothetical protein
VSGHIHAFDPKAIPARRLMTVDGGRHYAHVVPVLYTSMPRCMWRPNPKRPTWRCKAKPTKAVQMVWLRDDGVPTAFVCDEHVAAVVRTPLVTA